MHLYHLCIHVALAVLLAAATAAPASATGRIVSPPDTTTSAATFTVSGYVYDSPTAPTSGVDAVHIWAYPDSGGDPTFFGAATSLAPHTTCGGRNCWFSIPGGPLSPGGYTLVGSARFVATGAFAPFASVRVSIPATPPTVMTVATTAISTSAAAASPAGRSTAIGYDDKHDVFLQAWEDNGNVFGRFAGFDGTVRGEAFVLATNRLAKAALPVVAYSRGAQDDVFLVLFQSDAMAASTAKNVFAQLVRFTGQGLTGGTLLGAPLEVSNASSSAGVTQIPHAAVFNPAQRRFLLVWDERNPRSSVQLRHMRTDGTLAEAPVTLSENLTQPCFELSGPAVGVSAQGAAYDWQRGRYTITYTRDFSPRPRCPGDHRGKYAVLDAATLAPVGPAPVGTICQYFLPCQGDSAITYVAGSDAMVMNWSRVPFYADPWTYNVVAALVTASGTQRDGPVVLGGAGHYRGADVAFDPDAGRGVSVMTQSAAVNGGPGAATATDVVAVLIGPDGIPLTADLSLWPAATVTSAAAIVAARDGVFGVSFATTTGAVLQRLQVPMAQPGPRFSNVVSNLDGPTGTVRPGAPFNVVGWAIDFGASSGTGINAVHAWAYRSNGGSPIFLGEVEAFTQRDDVAAVFAPRFGPSGFQIATSGLPAGTYTIVAYPRSALTNLFSSPPPSTLTVAPAVAQPRMNIDIPATGSTVAPVFDVVGWAIDHGADSGGGADVVHVYAFAANGAATFLGDAPVDRPRPDVGSAFGPQFGTSGFRLTSPSLAPGQYRIVVYAHSTVTGTFNNSQFVDVTVRAPGDPVMTIDTPSPGASVSQPFNLAGWAIDRDAPSGPGVDAVHVWAFPANGASPIWVGTGQLNFARDDVGAIYGSQFTNSGYNVSVSVSGLTPGQYLLAVYAHSTVTGTFNQSRVVTVNIQ